MRFQAGARLGPYEITGPIGAGGMGEVYRALDGRLGREVAIKVLPRELAGDRERLARFEREARSASALNHPNIVTIHDFSTVDGDTWLVMELVPGESLRMLISRGPVPVKKLLTIASGIAQGLTAAHQAGIVHRDLKPENIVVATDGAPKILDFGLVKQVATRVSHEDSTALKVSMTGALMGTAAYMSPEQGRGEEVEFRSDQFAFGLILYEMATGRQPFRRATGVETLAAIVNDEPAPLEEALPEALVWIIERLLQKNPADRYGSTSDLAHDLVRLREASDRHPTSRLSPAKRKRTWVAATAVALAAAISILAIVIVTLRPEETRFVDPVYTAIATPELAEVHRSDVAVPVALSPNGTYLVVHGSDIHGTSLLSLRDLRNGQTRLLAEDAFNPGWSPDSRHIVFFAEGQLKTVPLDGGPSRTVCEASGQGTPSWHGDTILFAQFSGTPGIYRVNAAGGTPRLLKGPGSNPLPIWPHFLPDGKRFLYLTIVPGSGQTEIDHELRVASLDDESPTRLVADIDSRAVYANGQLLFVKDGTLMAQPFNSEAARTAGEARPIIEDLHYFRSTGAAAFTVSENGRLASRSARSDSRLVWMDGNGLELGQVASAPFYLDGRLSPDEERYAAGVVEPEHGSGDLWTWELSRDSPQRITFRLLDERSPVWAPDGRTIYYRSDAFGPPDILRLEPGSATGVVVYRGPFVEEPQDVSPDGNWLLTVIYAQGSADISLLPLNPPGPLQSFLETPFSEGSARFSPDGRRVAYVSNISGRPEIYIRPFQGPPTDVRVSSKGGTRPRWRKDGRELYYLSPEGGIMVAPIDENGRPEAARVLFQAANAVDFEVAANGTKFLVHLNESGGKPDVQLLMNWPSLLESR